MKRREWIWLVFAFGNMNHFRLLIPFVNVVQMLLQIAFTSKTIQANLAAKRFFSGVLSHMPDQFTFRKCNKIAATASKMTFFTLIFMCYHFDHRKKSMKTGSAVEREICDVSCSMIHQTYSACETSSTLIALIWFLAGVSSHVCVRITHK